MSQIRVDATQIHIGQRFSVSFQPTLRVPDDGREYPLPPGLGSDPSVDIDEGQIQKLRLNDRDRR